MKYTWKAPKFKADDCVIFEDAWGNIREGAVSDVETSYINGEAHHSYDILIHNTEAKRRLYHASEEKVRLCKSPRPHQGEDKGGEG